MIAIGRARLRTHGECIPISDLRGRCRGFWPVTGADQSPRVSTVRHSDERFVPDRPVRGSTRLVHAIERIGQRISRRRDWDAGVVVLVRARGFSPRGQKAIDRRARGGHRGRYVRFGVRLPNGKSRPLRTRRTPRPRRTTARSEMSSQAAARDLLEQPGSSFGHEARNSDPSLPLGMTIASFDRADTYRDEGSPSTSSASMHERKRRRH
jgi:hypothetical protein